MFSIRIFIVLTFKKTRIEERSGALIHVHVNWRMLMKLFAMLTKYRNGHLCKRDLRKLLLLHSNGADNWK